LDNISRCNSWLAPPLRRPPHACPHKSGPLYTVLMEWRRMRKKCTMRTCVRFPVKRRQAYAQEAGLLSFETSAKTRTTFG